MPCWCLQSIESQVQMCQVKHLHFFIYNILLVYVIDRATLALGSALLEVWIIHTFLMIQESSSQRSSQEVPLPWMGD